MSFSAIPTSQILTSAEKYCFFTPAQLKELSFVMEGIEKDPARQEQFFRDYATFIERKEWDDAWGKNNQEDKGGIRLAVTLAAVEEVIARRKEEQTAPLECLLESLPEIRVWMEYHEESYGKIGLEFDNGFAWIILRIFPGSVLRFGRLECNRSSFFGDVLYFENRITRERKAMLNGIYPFDAKGRITEKENAAFFSVPAGARCFGGYAGNLIRRNGSVEKEVTILENNEWKCILHPGDEVLYLHIPAGGPLTDVEDSLKRMKSYFFHLPDYHPKAFICSSWLFSPVLQEILGESSNLLHFQNIFQQIPAVTTQGGVISRVFGGKAVREGIRSVPWNTTLRKKIGEILERGENFPAGRVLLFPDEIEE